MTTLADAPAWLQEHAGKRCKRCGLALLVEQAGVLMIAARMDTNLNDQLCQDCEQPEVTDIVRAALAKTGPRLTAT